MAAVKASGLPAISIMISRLAPGQSLEAHYGPTRAVLRYHVGISIPQEKMTTAPYLSIWPCASAANCKERRLYWKQGGDLYFDDSFLHAARNPTDEERIILWLDLKRHDFSGWRSRWINELIFASLHLFPPAKIYDNIQRTNQLCSS